LAVAESRPHRELRRSSKVNADALLRHSAARQTFKLYRGLRLAPNDHWLWKISKEAIQTSRAPEFIILSYDDR
jgi:hypothetical protein